ncbi:hypothetical protein NU688_20035 [Variovorax sp. ZS18.2.2]|uniref:hypothetical protein n=1 Tax=Variovorax sp. ZS18.2.2 TaxID=2971255 RepID=UPI002151828C|nr:hypothetical protein [Variovorax sp. ZS18.2.2]MCR6478461.1 hypothetical protein [Variovorax sp. ZS18.2.2]
MARPERLQQQRTPLGVALLLYLCLALFGTTALASTPASQEEGWAERSIVSVATAPVAFAGMDATPMPVAMDAMPCALCYSAPAPSLHGISDECREHVAMAWPVHVSPVPEATYFDPGGRHVRLPVRILYCRWLD